jgi:ornithine carbamoyltransferase
MNIGGKVKKDFLTISDLSQEEIYDIFDLSKELKVKTKNQQEQSLLKGYTLAMIFAKPSARTRISFETGMFQLGGMAIYLAPSDIGLGKRESIKDVAQVISRYNNLIMARLFAHSDMLELAKYSSSPVINGLTDYNHPCQIMADAFTILEHLGTIENINITYIGDGNNVANSWINFASKIPLNLVICTPPGFEPDEITLVNATKFGKSSILIENDPKRAVINADILYTDVWVSMGQEKEAEKRKIIFQPYQLNRGLLNLAKPDAKVMHCLPAHRGDEITDDVMDGPQSIVFDEAENRLHVQKAIMVKLAQNKN